MKGCLVASSRAAINAIATAGKRQPPIEIEPDPSTFLLAFCGSGTGHMTQAIALVRLLQAKGMTLGGVVTDTDMPQRLLDEVVMPLGVPLLVLPAITLVTKSGVLPPHRLLLKACAVDRGLAKEDGRIREFLAKSRAALFINMWQISLGKFLALRPLPPSVRVLHIAAQCGQARGSTLAHSTGDLPPFREPVSMLAATAAKGTVEAMCSLFAESGALIPIHAAGGVAGSASLAPIIDIPEALQPGCKPLLLCYFLTQAPARALERLLHRHPMEGWEVHVFTPETLKTPRGRTLSLESHPKERRLFQELFARCTAVCCSTGNETIWEAVCRGVPVLTIPTFQHGEQIMNAVAHARALPHLVRTRMKLRIADVRWLTSFEQTDESRQESAGLRERCAGVAEGLDRVLAGPYEAPVIIEKM